MEGKKYYNSVKDTNYLIIQYVHCLLKIHRLCSVGMLWTGIVLYSHSYNYLCHRQTQIFMNFFNKIFIQLWPKFRIMLHIASMEWVAALWVGSNNQVSLKNQCKFSCQLYSYCLEISFALNFTEIKELKNYLYHQEYRRYAKVHKQAFPTE